MRQKVQVMKKPAFYPGILPFTPWFLDAYRLS